MRKLLSALVVFGMVFALGAPSQAVMRKDLKFVRGKIVDKNVERREITVLNYATDEEMTFYVENGWETSTGMGRDVIVSNKIGTNIAKIVKYPPVKKYK